MKRVGDFLSSFLVKSFNWWFNQEAEWQRCSERISSAFQASSEAQRNIFLFWRDRRLLRSETCWALSNEPDSLSPVPPPTHTCNLPSTHHLYESCWRRWGGEQPFLSWQFFFFCPICVFSGLVEEFPLSTEPCLEEQPPEEPPPAGLPPPEREESREPEAPCPLPATGQPPP